MKNLFERPLDLCICVPDAVGSCGFCRDKAGIKREKTVPDADWEPSAFALSCAALSAEAQRGINFNGGVSDPDALIPQKAIQIVTDDPNSEVKLTFHPDDFYKYDILKSPVVGGLTATEKRLHDQEKAAKHAFLYGMGDKKIAEQSDEWRNKECQEIADWLSLSVSYYKAIVTQYLPGQCKAVNFNQVRKLYQLNITTVGEPLFWHEGSRLWYPAYNGIFCEEATCGKAHPSGQPYGPCGYCETGVYHPETYNK